MSSFLFSILITVLSFLTVPFHEFHTSLAQVHYNKNTQSFEVSLRVFTDDLEAALTLENGNKKVTIDQAELADRLLVQYLTKRFALISKQNQKKPMNYVGKEIEVDVTWIYIEIPVNEDVNGMRIENSILIELFSDQVNIVNLKYLNNTKTLLFKPNQTLQAMEVN